MMWSGSIEAQRQAYEAFRKLKPKSVHARRRNAKKKKRRKGKRPAWRHENGFIDYRAYINSGQWKAKRAGFIEAAGGKCERCGSSWRLHVHHKHYRTLGRENRADVEVLCKACHESEHEADGVPQTNELDTELKAIVG